MSVAIPPRAVTLYRVAAGRLQVVDFQYHERLHPAVSSYTRQLGDEVERIYPMRSGKLEYGWWLTRGEAISAAVEQAEDKVEALENRLRDARELLVEIRKLLG